MNVRLFVCVGYYGEGQPGQTPGFAVLCMVNPGVRLGQTWTEMGSIWCTHNKYYHQTSNIFQKTIQTYQIIRKTDFINHWAALWQWLTSLRGWPALVIGMGYLCDISYILACKTSFWDQNIGLKQESCLIWEFGNVQKWIGIKCLILGQV